MKIAKKENGDLVLKLSKKEWQKIGEDQGWFKKAEPKSPGSAYVLPVDIDGSPVLLKGEGHTFHIIHDNRIIGELRNTGSGQDLTVYTTRQYKPEAGKIQKAVDIWKSNPSNYKQEFLDTEKNRKRREYEEGISRHVTEVGGSDQPESVQLPGE
tara:strand:+ start:3868 stop:4329 length:462 start_codon:yes stop_codon:yes gene_type:complete